MKIMILMMVAVSLSACGPELVQEGGVDAGAAQVDAGEADAGVDCSQYANEELKCCRINERYDAPTNSCIDGESF